MKPAQAEHSSKRITGWIQKYFLLRVTTAPSSQKVQKRDLDLFVRFMVNRTGNDFVKYWIPSLSARFIRSLRKRTVGGNREFSDRTIDRVVAHLKSFSKWIDRLAPFSLGDPMNGISRLKIGTELEVNRALTAQERKKILRAADRLLKIGGSMEKWRKGQRRYRNRAIIYTLIETGMTRTAITQLDLANIHFRDHSVTVKQRGFPHVYHISENGLKAIKDYVKAKRHLDAAKWNSPALFLSAETVRLGNGRLRPIMVNSIWNHVCKIAGVSGRTPHSARHAMGKHIMEKTGSPASVQLQLGHRTAQYVVQYSSSAARKLKDVINKR